MEIAISSKTETEYKVSFTRADIIAALRHRFPEALIPEPTIGSFHMEHRTAPAQGGGDDLWGITFTWKTTKEHEQP